VAIPYHNYDSNCLIVWGSADAGWVSNKLKGQQFVPLLDTMGRAMVSAWIVDYKDTVIKPYKELVLNFHVVPPEHQGRPPKVPAGHTITQLQLFEDKKAYPYIYKLWLDKELPIKYGRELLGCDKYLDTSMQISFKGLNASVEFHHVQGELNTPTPGPIMSGNVKLDWTPPRLGGTGLWSLVRAYGVRRVLGMTFGAKASWHVVNPPGIIDRPDSVGYNPVWDFWFQSKPTFTNAPTSNNFKYGGEMAEMGFKEHIYQHDSHLQAVLLPPWTFAKVEGGNI